MCRGDGSTLFRRVSSRGVTPRSRRPESLRGGGAQSRSPLDRPRRTCIPRGRLLLAVDISRARVTPIPFHRESPQQMASSRRPERPSSDGAQMESSRSHLRRTNSKTYRSCLVLKHRPRRRQAKILCLVAMLTMMMEGRRRVRGLDAFLLHNLHMDPERKII